MSDDFDDFALPDPPVMAMGSDATFDQAGIDALFGDLSAPTPTKVGVKAVIESNVISHERLPMLEVVYDRMVRTFATSMRNLTSDAIDVSLEEISTIRFGDFMSRVMLPAMIGVFRVEEWENYGLISVDSGLIYAVVDALLGGRRSAAPLVIDGRGFTSIETGLVARMLELALSDMSAAMMPITPNTMKLERIETSPRFAAIATPTNICAVATFRVDMEGRGGKFSVLLPYATIEPVRHQLGQRFMGEKFAGDNVWEAHMASEIRNTQVMVDVVMGEELLTLQQISEFKVGDTVTLHQSPNDALKLQCGGVTLGRAHIGQRRNNIAIRLVADLAKEIRA
ncbi:flagellar motor switch protein FliM [Sphingomonas aerophila]|jgi:flagellar motor switch protein FliM|uniref:Flagellar motor switch protein FliM n=1 Tax=Sphingomonas aerophila TaxID=1344948 RepID=A0A7W9BAN0_9SPHN|nr:flagellar motor switch protein FliM [Sphingomonas aerophila]MBB5713680.1 flagellar motor switch protein FliM [Sphingomonas aerophila]